MDGHSSGTCVAASFTQPTRVANRNSSESLQIRATPIRSCSGWGLPCQSCCQARGCAFTAPFHPYQSKLWRFIFCGTFPGVTPAGRYPAPYSRGARTFLPCTLSGLARAAIQLTGGYAIVVDNPKVNQNRLHLYQNVPLEGEIQGEVTMTNAETLKVLNRLKLLARFMDNGWSIPFTKIRFGADPILGLIPGGGDLVSMAVSLYVVAKAYKMGVPNTVLLKMMGNIAIDTGIGAVPVLGDAFDLLFKSNIRNTDLLHDFLVKNGKV